MTNLRHYLLQCLSSITEFPDLIATIQTMRHINPLQVTFLVAFAYIRTSLMTCDRCAVLSAITSTK